MYINLIITWIWVNSCRASPSACRTSLPSWLPPSNSAVSSWATSRAQNHCPNFSRKIFRRFSRWPVSRGSIISQKKAFFIMNITFMIRPCFNCSRISTPLWNWYINTDYRSRFLFLCKVKCLRALSYGNQQVGGHRDRLFGQNGKHGSLIGAFVKLRILF